MFFFAQKPNIRKNILLANHTTFRLGGPARFFCDVKNKKELVEAIKWAKEKKLPFFILGGGSNLLASDEGFEGLVIKIKSENIKIKSCDGEFKFIEAEAGAPLIKLVLESIKDGYSGLEWGFGIPGTVGGAVFGNAGRLGQDISQTVERVKILDPDSLEEKEFRLEDCDFKYRESRFKDGGFIILSAVFKLKKAEKEDIEKTLMKAKNIASQSPPWPSAGCAFKNYEIKGENDILLQNFPELRRRVQSGKIGVGFLIDQCGLRGRQIGGAKIWEKHANHIVNAGGAKTRDVLEMIELVKKTVKEKYKIELEEEVRIIDY